MKGKLFDIRRGHLPNTRRSAFTLIEIVIAISLVVGLMAGVWGMYHQSERIRHRVLEQARFAACERHVMDFITGELRAGIVYPFLNMALNGQPDSMDFMTVVFPGPAAWAAWTDPQVPIPPEQDIQRVAYRLRIVEDEDGNLVNTGLERTCQKVLAAQVLEDPTAAPDEQVVQTDLLAPDIHFLNLRYFDGTLDTSGADTTSGGEGGTEETGAVQTGWQETWPVQAGGLAGRGADLPMAVEVTLGAAEKPEDMQLAEYLQTYPTFRRVVYIPGSRRSLRGTVMVGGAGR